MTQGVINEPVVEYFTIVDAYGIPVSGVDPGEITSYVYNPSDSEVSGSVSESFTELGAGNYKYTFTPNAVGRWYVMLTHPTYFPWGKNDDVEVHTGDISDIYNNVIKTLGLVHHNIYIDNAEYDDLRNMTAARVRIYSDAASVGTDSNVVETYRIEAESLDAGQFTYWKQVVTP